MILKSTENFESLKYQLDIVLPKDRNPFKGENRSNFSASLKMFTQTPPHQKKIKLKKTHIYAIIIT